MNVLQPPSAGHAGQEDTTKTVSKLKPDRIRDVLDPESSPSARNQDWNLTVKNNSTILIVAIVCLVAGAAGYWLYQERNRSGVEVSVGGRTLSVETR